MSERLAHRLRAETEGEVLFDAPSRGRYATDASVYQIMPVGVLVPRNERDIATALDIARDLKIPVLPRGGGTSQCGQAIGAALVIDNSKYIRRIRALDVERRTVVVEPGLVLDHLNAELKRHGLWYPVHVSTSAQATLGGMAGNNSCGSRSIAYGNMVHNVQGISAWLSDGALVDFGPVPDLAGAAPRSPASSSSWQSSIAPKSRRAGPRCCAGSPATTSTSSTTGANGPTPSTTASISPTCWSGPRARSPTPRA